MRDRPPLDRQPCIPCGLSRSACEPRGQGGNEQAKSVEDAEADELLPPTHTAYLFRIRNRMASLAYASQYPYFALISFSVLSTCCCSFGESWARSSDRYLRMFSLFFRSTRFRSSK